MSTISDRHVQVIFTALLVAVVWYFATWAVPRKMLGVMMAIILTIIWFLIFW